MSNEKNATSWWTTLPGVIAAVAGLLTAVGSLLVVLNTLGVFEKPKAPTDQNAPKQAEPQKIADEGGAKKPLLKKKAVQENHHSGDGQTPLQPTRPATYVIAGTNHNFVEKEGYLFSSENGNPLCPTPPGLHTGCYALELQYRQNWRNTPDGYIANGRKVKTFSNRGEREFEILGTKRAFYVDDGHLYDYSTGTILCPWPKAGVAKCEAIETQYQDRWRNTPNGFIADGREFDGDEVMRQVRQGLF